MDKEQFIREALCLPTNALDYHVSQHLSELFPTRALVEGGDGLFDIEDYSRARQEWQNPRGEGAYQHFAAALPLREKLSR